MTRYIDARNENISLEDAIALASSIAKPYPSGWYQSEKSFITERNANKWRDYQDAKESLNSGDSEEDEVDWSEFTCPVQRWEYLVTWR